MSCTKHHEDITIAILGGNYPKTIYNMAPFEFANTVANSTGVQGAECKKLHYMHLEKAQMIKSSSPCNSLWKTTQETYMAWPFWKLGKTWSKQKKGRGLTCKITIPQFLEGEKCKINLTIMISSSSYPKNIYNMPLVEKGVEIQFEFEIKFKLN